jgi:hypothetical protein
MPDVLVLAPPDWFIGWVTDYSRAFGVDAVLTDTILRLWWPAFAAAGVNLTLIDGGDSVRACGAFVASVIDGSMKHHGEPEFTAAIIGASRRAVGDAWKWSRKNSTVYITPLVSGTLALWAYNTFSATADPGVYVI